MSVPAVFPYDSEQDRWRFLPGSLQWMLGSFSEIEIAAEGSSITGFFRSLAVCLVMFSKKLLLDKVLCFTVVPLLNIMAACLEETLSSANTQFAANFSALAKK